MVKQVLDNGLTILIEERPEIPIAAIVTYVKTGYFDEPDDIAGISHVFEHMFFKGTNRRPEPEQIARETKALGGILNAGTSYESTSYYTALPVENFEKALDIQFDALTDPLLDPEELRREIEVVIQESQQKLDNPTAYSLEKTWELAFDHHRIRRWRIGLPDELRALTRDDLLLYYHGRYCPQNIILCIVGGVESGAALQVAEKLYSEIPIREMIQNPSPRESDRTGLRYLRLKGDIKQKLMHISFHAPPILDADYYPLSVAVDILGQGRSSRLYRSLMEGKRTVSTISSSYSAYQDIGVVTISAEVLAREPAQAAVGIFDEIEKIKKEPVRLDELEKIKTVMESDLAFEREQVLGRASRLAYFEALGDWRLSDEFVERLRKVDAADAARAAAQYLIVERASALEYVPEDAELPEYSQSKLEKRLLRAVETIPSTLPVCAVSEDGNLRRAVLSSGASLITEIEKGSPVVGIAVYFKGGRIAETPDIAGITELSLRASLKGTSRYSAEEIAGRIESLGTAIGISNSTDYSGYSMRILARNFDQGLQLLSDVITDTSFTEKEVTKEREALRADIRRLQDSSFSLASDLLARAAFSDHPYGLPDYGEDETVAAMTRDQVAHWHRSICAPEAAVVSIVGDFDLDAATKSVEGMLHKLSATGRERAEIPVVFPTGIREKSVTRDRAQTAAAIGFPGVTTADPGRYTLDVVGSLTSGLGGRLFAAVRGRMGLAYVVSSASHAAAGGGIFTIYTATSPKNELVAREAVFAELYRLREEPAESMEVERAKNYLKGAKLISLQTSVSRARERAANEVYGRGLSATQDYLDGIARVTPEDVLNACRQHFSTSRYCLGVVRGMINDKG